MGIPHLFIIQFAKDHPGALVAIVGFLLTICIGIIGYFIKRSIDSQAEINETFRKELHEFLIMHMTDMVSTKDMFLELERKTDERLERLSGLLVEQFAKLSDLMAKQGERLSKLEGEHSVLSKHHYALTRASDMKLHEAAGD